MQKLASSNFTNSIRSGSTQSDDPDHDPIPECVQLDPLSRQLAEAGAITLAVAAFFKEMHSVGTTKSGPVNPGESFCKSVNLLITYETTGVEIYIIYANFKFQLLQFNRL